MTTEMLDSTISKNPQELSSAEYVDSHENSIATIPRDDASPKNFGETFSCDVGGKPIEIKLPEDAWDVVNETVWLTQVQLAELYRSSVQNVGQRIRNILEDEELQADSVIKESFITATDGKSYRTKLYNLDMILSLGYRIKSKVAIKFRQWATSHLKELMTKGRTELQPMSDAEIMSRALEIAHRTLALREERIKALTAERDEAIRTKAMIGSRREATAMATASAKARECEKLREQIGDSETYKRATAIPWLSEYFDTRNDGLYLSLAAQLKKIEASMPPEFAHKPTPDTRYGSVKAYHIAVIDRLHEIVREKLPVDKKFMAKYRKEVSVQSEND